MKREALFMRQSGITTDGHQVCAGVFALVGTHGTPLEIILHRFKDSGRIMDWLDYITDALRDGHNPHTIKARILCAVGDVYGSEHRKQVELRINKINLIEDGSAGA